MSAAGTSAAAPRAWAEGPDGAKDVVAYVNETPALYAVFLELHLLEQLKAEDDGSMAWDTIFTVANHWRENELARAAAPIDAEQLAAVKDQCETGLQIGHECPAMFALAAIYADLFAGEQISPVPEAGADGRHAEVRRLHEAITRLAPQFGLPWKETWEQLTEAEKDCLALAIAEVFPPSGGWCIRHVDGRWRTMDSLGMPDWTDDPAKALCCRLREHVDAYAADDPEDVRIVPAVAPSLVIAERLPQLGGTYANQDGGSVRMVGINYAGTDDETLVDEVGVNRYSRRLFDAGRVTGTAHDYSHPGNLVRPIHALKLEMISAPSHVASSGDGKLTEPAWIGNTSFGVGSSERMVIERAQREFKYQTAPEQEKARIERGAKALAEFQTSLSTTRRTDEATIHADALLAVDSFCEDTHLPHLKERLSSLMENVLDRAFAVSVIGTKAKECAGHGLTPEMVKAHYPQTQHQPDECQICAETFEVAAEALRNAVAISAPAEAHGARERLRLAMLFIEEWSNWWSYALGVDDDAPMPAEEKAAAEKMAESLGARARDMVIDNRRFLAIPVSTTRALPAGWRAAVAKLRLGLAGGSCSPSNASFEMEYGGTLLDAVEEALEGLEIAGARAKRRGDDKVTPIATLLRTWAHNESTKRETETSGGPNRYLVELLLDAADEHDWALAESNGDPTETRGYAAMADALELARQARTEEGKQVDFVEISGEPLLELVRMLRSARPAIAPEQNEPTTYGRDCPKGMVQVEFVSVDPKLKQGKYGWRPSDHAFIDVYVDGERFSIHVGNLTEYGHPGRRGIHINAFAERKIDAVNAISLLIADTVDRRG